MMTTLFLLGAVSYLIGYPAYRWLRWRRNARVARLKVGLLQALERHRQQEEERNGKKETR